MVNDPKNSAHIHWMPDGLSFQVTGREQFEKTILPKYFKHSNFSSFVRQLNMYGWHKVQDVTAGAMQSGEETWQFQSPNFIRGRDDLLDNIVRNRGSKGSDDEDEPDLHTVLEELEVLRQSQQAVAEQLKQIKQDNELLWRESYQTRERHQSFSDTLEKILRFLASVYGNPSKILGASNSAADGIVKVASPPVPQNRSRLMLRDAAERSPILELPDNSQRPSPSATVVSPLQSDAVMGSLSPMVRNIVPTAQNMYDQNDFLDMIPLDNPSPNAPTPRPYFPPDLMPSPNGSVTSPLEAGRQAINGLATDQEHSISRLNDSSRTIADLSHELDLQGQALDQMQDWIQNNLVPYSAGHVESNSSSHSGGVSNASNTATPQSDAMPSAFDVGDFLASPNNAYFEDEPVAQYPDDLEEIDTVTTKRPRIA